MELKSLLQASLQSKGRSAYERPAGLSRKLHSNKG
jgi:hypothetical protein